MDDNQKPGPPPTYGEPRNIPKRVNITASDAALIDQLRGNTPVSTWIYEHLRDVLDSARKEAEA